MRNPAIGPHLSPKMITATGGEDLYHLWLSVGLDFDDVEEEAEEQNEEL